MLKPVVPGDKNGREGRGGQYWGAWVRRRRKWGDVCQEPQGVKGASRAGGG